MLKVGEAKEIKVMLLDDDGNPTAGTITYTVYDENDASFATGTMAATGVTGFYTMSFTPDAAGAWSVLVVCLSPNRTAVKMFDVGVGVEQDTYDTVVLLSAVLVAHDTTIKALLATVQADLDNPNQYKADVTALALEATLTAMKGAGWTTETLKVIKDTIDALNDLAQSDILSDATPFAGAVIGALADTSNIGGSLTARHKAVFDTIHLHVGMVVADKTNLTANETAIKTTLERKFHVDILDDDDIDAGEADLEIYGLIIVGTSVTDMAKLNKLTDIGVPVITRNAEVALTVLRMGDDSGGFGTSWGENAAETQINIINNTHQITLTESLGNLTVYSAAGKIQWVRKTDLVADAIQLAEVAGDNTKNTIVVLPYDETDEDGNSVPAVRVFIGLRDYQLFTALATALYYQTLDWIIHQGKREVEIEGIGKINQIKKLLEDGTYGLAALNTDLDAILTDTADIQPRVPRIVTYMDFKSLPLQVTLTSVAGDRGLVDVVVSGLPAGVTIIGVEGFVYCDTVENTFAGINYLESTKVQVKKKVAGTDRDAITLEANKIFRFTAQMVRGGTVLSPDWATATAAGILAEVTGNATYQMWFDLGETAQNNIVLDGAVFMLRIWYSV